MFGWTNAQGCYDVLKDCHKPSMMLHCDAKSGPLVNYLKRVCRRTCGFCTGPSVRPSTTVEPTRIVTNSPNYRGCGYSGVTTRVIGGVKSKQSQWPWQVALRIGGGFNCGATLIAPQWVVTAAHCIAREDFRKPEDYSFMLGDLNRYDRSGKEQYARGAKIFKHPNYSYKDNDIALIKLKHPVELNRDVTPACLPRNTPRPDTTCYISGWGKTDPIGQAVYDLQHASLKIISNQECCKTNCDRRTPVITDKMMCAANRGKITSGCHGDSGGPLVCQRYDGRWELQGVVSWGSGQCDASHKSTVFTRVTEYQQWMNEIMKNNQKKKKDEEEK